MEGLTHPDFERVAKAFRTQLERTPGGAAVCVWHRGEKVVDLWGGKRDALQPWLEDTMALSFSTTKGVMSSLVHTLVDDGVIRYADRVARYWPEFASAGKGHMTVRDVLTHEVGLSHIREMLADASELRDWDHVCAILARSEPSNLAGDPAYHALTFGFLVGEIVRRATGAGISEMIAEKLSGPLGLDGLYCGLPESEDGRVAQLQSRASRKEDPKRKRRRHRFERRARTVVRVLTRGRTDLKDARDALAPRGIDDFDWNAPETWRAHIPAANGIFTARSLAKMYAALCGSLDGVLLVKPGTFRSLSTVQSRGGDRVLIFPMGWRLGYHRVMNPIGPKTRAFGHAGYGGSGAWCDAERGLSLGFIVNAGRGTPVGDMRLGQLTRAALLSADGR